MRSWTRRENQPCFLTSYLPLFWRVAICRGSDRHGSKGFDALGHAGGNSHVGKPPKPDEAGTLRGVGRVSVSPIHLANAYDDTVPASAGSPHLGRNRGAAL